MLKILKNFFESNASNSSGMNDDENLKLLCGLMIEAANTDGSISNDEISKIKNVLTNSFQKNSSTVDLYLNEAIINKENSKSLFFYTSKINKEYDIEKKTLLIQALWEIVLSDGNLHDYESSLIRRLSGLLYISDVESGNARKRALNKLSNKQ